MCCGYNEFVIFRCFLDKINEYFSVSVMLCRPPVVDMDVTDYSWSFELVKRDQ